MNEKTELGVYKFPDELVGKEARMVHNSYFDSYLDCINGAYPILDVLGVDRAVNIGNKNNKDISELVMDSPLQNTEGERVLAQILIESAHKGIWQPKIIDVSQLTDTNIQTSRDYLEAVEKISSSYSIGKIDAGMIFGIAVAEKGGLVKTNDYDPDQVVILPSQKFVEYLIRKTEKLDAGKRTFPVSWNFYSETHSFPKNESGSESDSNDNPCQPTNPDPSPMNGGDDCSGGSCGGN